MTDQTRQINPNGTNHWLDPMLEQAAATRAADQAPANRLDHDRNYPLPSDAQNRNYSDAELCATYASEALEAGRYTLAVELSRLAVRAQQHERAQQPTPITINPPAGATAARIEMFGPGADRVRNVPLIGRTREEFPRLDDQISHAPSVCTYREEINGQGVLCHQPIAWSNAGESHPGGWYHLDPEITDHQPVVAGQ